jgi:hypothetical protein
VRLSAHRHGRISQPRTSREPIPRQQARLRSLVSKSPFPCLRLDGRLFRLERHPAEPFGNEYQPAAK